MRLRTTILLAIALVVASTIAWIDLSRDPRRIGLDTEINPPGEGITHILDFASGDVERIELQRNEWHTTLTRTQDGWSGASDARAVEDFLDEMQQLAQIIVLDPNDGGVHDYGLDPPAARIVLSRTTGDPIDLRIGNANPSSTGVYAQVGADGPVTLTGALALWDLDKLVRSIKADQASTRPTTAAVIGESSGKWESGYGSTFFNIVGTVRNQGDGPIAWVKLRADLLDEQQAVVSSVEFFNYQAESAPDESGTPVNAPRTDAQPIAPGGSDRFRVSFLKEEAPPFATYRVTVVETKRASPS